MMLLMFEDFERVFFAGEQMRIPLDAKNLESSVSCSERCTVRAGRRNESGREQEKGGVKGRMGERGGGSRRAGKLTDVFLCIGVRFCAYNCFSVMQAIRMANATKAKKIGRSECKILTVSKALIFSELFLRTGSMWNAL